MQVDSTNGVLTTTQQVLVAAGVCGLVTVPTLLRAPETMVPDAVMLFGALAGLLLLLTAATTALLLSRRSGGPRDKQAIAWTTTALLLLGSQTLLVCEFVLMGGTRGPGTAGTAAIELAVSVAALGVAALGLKGIGVRHPLLPGTVVVLAAALGRLALILRTDLPEAPAGLAALFVSLAVAANVGTGMVIGQTFALPDPAVRRLCALLGLLGLATLTRNPGFELTPVAVAVNAALAVVVAWAVCRSVLLLSVPISLRGATAAAGELSVPAPRDRDQAERMHEIRSTVAGLRAAHELLGGRALDEATSRRLLSSISAELARLERLVARPTSVPTAPLHEASVVDLDNTLSVLADTHSARGRSIEWRSSGAQLEGSADDVCVALNILLENSARHARGSHSTIEVGGDESMVEILVSDDGPGIDRDVRDSLFEWGVSSDHDRGDGIGLAMARRLVSDQGGSLDLVDEARQGTSFSIKLPSARTSPENA